jgi:hypothetical protein
VAIRLVAVRLGEGPVVFLFSTDLTLTATQIIRVYAARFPIETGFRNSKQEFGFSTYQVRSGQSIERIAHLCLWSQTLLQLRCWGVQPQAIYGAWRKPLAYLTLAQQKAYSLARCGNSHGLVHSSRSCEKEETLPRAA